MAKLFNKKVLNRHLQNHSIKNKEEKMDRIKNWKVSLKENKRANETRLQGAFLNAIFSLILGYKGETNTSDGKFTMKAEPTTEVDATKPDGSLGFFEINGQDKTKAVIELKGPDKSLDTKQKRSGKDYGTPVEQAFNYATKHDGCKWVIVSNMIEIRLYKYTRGQGHYEEFLIPELDQEENFNKFTLLLSQDNLINKNEKSLTEKLSEETVTHEDDISTEFYNLYKKTRIELFEHLKENNEDYKSTLLLEKAQKFLDRIIFICFCEDLGLLPPETLHSAIERGKSSFVPDETEIWNQMRGVFKSIDKGNPEHNINAYNGGLFKYDEALDGLTIKNEFFEDIDEIAAYDFDSELDVNILGHIFEQSINDIEEIKADIKDEDYDEQDSKRKKDGIFYTPEYITKYIVENSIGQYLEDVKEELGYSELPDIESATTPQVEGKYKKQHFDFYDEYEEKLRDIKILDPACGSGAFLNQAFDYLLKEHKWIQRQRSLIEEGQMNIYSREGLLRQILQDNIYGVDLNEESVEITKLSLWLKTANKNKPLANLDDNIKCGNSLIDNPEVAGDKALDWNEEFAEIMKDGGFDVVIGNPPWGASFNEKETTYLQERYGRVIVRMVDSYIYFIDLADKITKSGNPIGFIIPSTMLNQTDSRAVRNLLLNREVSILINMGEDIFGPKVLNTSTIFISQSQRSLKNIFIKDLQKLSDSEKASKLESTTIENSYNLEQWKKIVQNDPDLTFFINDIKAILLLDRLRKKHISFIDSLNGKIHRGVSPDLVDQHVITKKQIQNYNLEQELIKPSVSGSQINPYQKWKIDQYIIYTNSDTKIKNYPNTLSFMSKFKGQSNCKEVKKGKHPWYSLHRPRNPKIFSAPKFIGLTTSKKIELLYDEKNDIYVTDAMYVFKISKKYNPWITIAILQSSLFLFLYRIANQGENRVIPQVKASKLQYIPFPDYKPDNNITLKKKVEKMYELNKKLAEIKSKNSTKENNKINMNLLIKKYTSNTGPTLSEIVKQDGFYNKIYSGRARKVREMTVTINDNIITLYADKSSSGKYELMKFQVNNKYQRQYIKLYLENFTEEQLEAANEFSGSLPKKILQIEIPDYNKYNVVRKVVNEWNKLQNEITELEDKIEKTDNEIDQMVYDLYDLTDEEIEIVENSLE